MFHRHKWEEQERAIALPVKSIKAEGVPEFSSTVDRWAFGVTTIVYRCSDCTEIRVVEMLGQVYK